VCWRAIHDGNEDGKLSVSMMHAKVRDGSRWGLNEENVRGADGRHTPVGQQHSTERIYLRRRHYVFVDDQRH